MLQSSCRLLTVLRSAAAACKGPSVPCVRSIVSSTSAAGTPPKDDGWLPPQPSFYTHQDPAYEKYNRQRNLMKLGVRIPAVAGDAYIAPSAVVVGDVNLSNGVSIMHGSVVRGDLQNITIGAFSSVQENCVIHAARRLATGLPARTWIGDSVTIGAGSLVRSCEIQDEVCVGERCIIMEGSIVESKAILLPGSVVPPAKRIPAQEVWGGQPVKFIRKVTPDEADEVASLAVSHLKYRDLYVAEELPYGNEWKRAEAVDPVADRLYPDPDQQPPEWVWAPPAARAENQ